VSVFRESSLFRCTAKRLPHLSACVCGVAHAFAVEFHLPRRSRDVGVNILFPLTAIGGCRAFLPAFVVSCLRSRLSFICRVLSALIFSLCLRLGSFRTFPPTL
jgi:hypothetical protein